MALDPDNESISKISWKDLAIMSVAPLSWVTPDWLWKLFCLPIAFLSMILHPVRTYLRIKTIEKVLPTNLKILGAALIEIRFRSGNNEELFQYLREYSPFDWQPRIRLIGGEHIKKSLEYGQGGILWVAPCLYSNLVVKKGLQQAGFLISHLSTNQHGPSNTKFGKKFINTKWIESENRYLDERIIIPNKGSLGYIRKLEQKLRRNELVMMSCMPIRDQKRVAQPILNGSIELATGSSNLSLVTGAALLPVFLICKYPGVFEIIIEPPLELPDAKSRHEIIELLLNIYTDLLGSYLLRYPHLFKVWHLLDTDFIGNKLKRDRKTYS